MTCQLAKTSCCALTVLLALACNSSEPGAEAGEASGLESDTGDGDGDGDGDPTGDGDGDECPPPDPPLATTLDGTWAELGAPAGSFSCTLNVEEGAGAAWDLGLLQAEGVEGSVDFLSLGGDAKTARARPTASAACGSRPTSC